MATATGWTYRVIDEMTLPEVRGLLDYWRTSPPLHILFKAYVGFKPTEPDEASEQLEADQYINRVSTAEFDEILKAHGLPVGGEANGQRRPH